MITVKERIFEEALPIIKELGGSLNSDQRAVIMDEDGKYIGYSVLALDKGVVDIKEVKVTDRPFPYFDLLARSTLNLINLFVLPIKVRVKANEYYKPFGFVQEGEYMYIMSDKIVFKGSICGD